MPWKLRDGRTSTPTSGEAAEPVPQPAARGRSRVWPTALVLGILLVLAMAVSVLAWRSLGDVALGLHGWLALVVGTLVTLLLGGGLVALVFHSARRGYDERAGHL